MQQGLQDVLLKEVSQSWLRLSDSDLLQGVQRFPAWSATFPATSTSSGEACTSAFYGSCTFKFSNTRENMEDELPTRTAGI
jgi:hypothetical protein